MKQLYKLNFLVLIAILISNTPLLAGTYGGGDGTEAAPFQLGTADHLIELSTTEADWGAEFILTADIDMAEKTFNSIGYTTSESVSFTGTIDGQNHVICNLTATLREGQSDLGFIGHGNQCTIKNLGFSNISVETPVAGGGIQGGVGMVGYMEGNDASVSNCFTIGRMSARNGMGGIVGRLNFGKISNCMASVDFNAYYDNRTGGIVGIVHSNADNAPSAVSKCVAYACFKKRDNQATLSGGIMGQVDNDIPDVQVAADCYFNATSGGITQPKNSNITTMGTAISVADLRTQATYSGLTFPTDWKMLTGGFAVPNNFPEEKFNVTVTPTVNADSTGTGTIDPATAQTVALGNSVTFNFTTEDYVSAISLNKLAQTIDRPTSLTIDGVYSNINMVVAFNKFPAGISSNQPADLKMYVANSELKIEGANQGSNQYAIYSISGKLISRDQFEGANLTRQVNLPNGIYIVQVNAGLNTISKKVVIR